MNEVAALVVRPGAVVTEGRHACNQQRWKARAELFYPEPETRQPATRRRIEQHVRAFDQREELFAAGLTLQIEHYRAFAKVVLPEEERTLGVYDVLVERADAPRRTPVRWLDLDNVCTQTREHATAVLALLVCNFHNADIREIPLACHDRVLHRASHCRVASRMQCTPRKGLEYRSPIVKRFLSFVPIALLLAVSACQFLRGPDPAAILASIDPPPAPVRSAEAELATLRVAPGFRVELVASEPLVVDPVAMDWDDAGRLYVVEMRGFMPDIEGRGEEQPAGRVVVLEDTDADGRMDRSEVFLDRLVLPRAVAVLPEGVLIGAPPDLLLCGVAYDSQGVPRCREKRRLTHYATSGGNVEHAENRLLPGLDGWIYNAKSSRRFRLRNHEFEIDPTVARGQWGIAQDNDGRLYQNHNSGWLYVDTFPAEYTLRQPAVAARLQKRGINVDLASGEDVFGVRVAPGLNRADLPRSLRRDGRQKIPTAVSGLAIQRGDQFGVAYLGDAFVPESAGAVVAHFEIDWDGTGVQAQHRLYPDEDYGEREFLAATDERFRPVDAHVGPDGALWIIDMYRGVIQHASFVSEYLRDYVARQDLEAPGSTGRIWRVVREDRPITYRPPPLDTLEDQLAGLDHPNGWVRDRAQRRIVFENAPGAVAALRRLEAFTRIGRRHALFALYALGSIDPDTFRAAIADEDPALRRLGLRVGEALLPRAAALLLEESQRLRNDPDRWVRLQALHTLGDLPNDLRPLETFRAIGRSGSAVERQVK